MIQEITDSNHEQILKDNKAVLITFKAPWCGVCHLLTPIIEELSNEYGDKVFIGKVEVDENSILTNKYGIRSIPATYFIKDGEIVDKHIGSMLKPQLKQKMDVIVGN